MATLAKPAFRLRSDDFFFPAMALLILAVVVYGFAQSYFLAGMVRAKLPNTLVHIHGALFVSWIFLLILQNALVALRKVRWHITVGILGVILPPLMIVAGFLTMLDSIRRVGTPIPPTILLVGDTQPLILFAVLITWGLLDRRKPASHKRLMLMSTLAIIAPAIDRWPILHHYIPATFAVFLSLPLLLLLYDAFTLKRIHRSTWVPYALMVVFSLTLIPLAQTPLAQRAVAWVLKG
ncbi:hypothetical protein [Granulicella tundricola]|uniref:Uncharacterized protein n=1 Tax=Granulicella tundricola (strain ATCC BAA-1859 / DSM 23138 / MP5ACTX9) TaxID=1198114 RepID=E8X7P5_GRATM|nr:hypothetical protein [Granulicella tundricola]ADW71479.1 hypothetical protein AciX9_4543 [Granulicella tundricola MP5ACTX9]